MSQNVKDTACWPSSNVFSMDSQTFLHCLKPLQDNYRNVWKPQGEDITMNFGHL